MGIEVRKATPEDVPGIVELVTGYSERGELLPRPTKEISSQPGRLGSCGLGRCSAGPRLVGSLLAGLKRGPITGRIGGRQTQWAGTGNRTCAH